MVIQVAVQYMQYPKTYANLPLICFHIEASNRLDDRTQIFRTSNQKLKIIFLGLRQLRKNIPRKAPPIPIITDSNSKCKFIAYFYLGAPNK